MTLPHFRWKQIKYEKKMKQEEHINILARSLDIQKLEYSIELEEIKVNKRIEAFKILKNCIPLNYEEPINNLIFVRLYSLKKQLKFLQENENTTLVDYKQT